MTDTLLETAVYWFLVALISLAVGAYILADRALTAAHAYAVGRFGE